MKLYERFFVASYALTKRLDRYDHAPEWTAIIHMGILSMINIYTVLNLIRLRIGSRFQVPYEGYWMWIGSLLMVGVWYVIFLSNREFAGLVARYKRFDERKKLGLHLFSILYDIASILLWSISYYLVGALPES